MIGGTSASFSLGEKRGETQKEAGVYPSFHRRKGSPPGEGLSRTGRGCGGLRKARLGFLEDLRPEPRLDVSV